MKLDIDSLQAFVTVVEAGSFTKAAKLLCLTQSAISWKLKRLEDRLGCALLQRDKRQLRLTHQGRELLGYAKTILTTHEQAIKHFQASDLTGTVRLGSTDDIAMHYLANIIKRFQHQHPSVKLEIRVDFPNRLDQCLEQGSLDVAIMPILASELRPQDHTLWRDTLQWVHSSTADFSQQPIPLISLGAQCFLHDLAIEQLTQAPLDFDILLECSSTGCMQTALRGGLGVALTFTRLMTDAYCIWKPPIALAALPTTLYVVRCLHSENDSIEQALIRHIQLTLATF